jgi:hypothetical protein
MEPDNPLVADLSDVAEKAVEVDRLVNQAKKLSDELVSTVSMLNSIFQPQEQKDGN